MANRASRGVKRGNKILADTKKSSYRNVGGDDRRLCYMDGTAE